MAHLVVPFVDGRFELTDHQYHLLVAAPARTKQDKVKWFMRQYVPEYASLCDTGRKKWVKTADWE